MDVSRSGKRPATQQDQQRRGQRLKSRLTLRSPPSRTGTDHRHGHHRTCAPALSDHRRTLTTRGAMSRVGGSGVRYGGCAAVASGMVVGRGSGVRCGGCAAVASGMVVGRGSGVRCGGWTRPATKVAPDTAKSAFADWDGPSAWAPPHLRTSIIRPWTNVDNTRGYVASGRQRCQVWWLDAASD